MRPLSRRLPLLTSGWHDARMAKEPTSALERALAQELDRRIAELATLDDAAFGRLSVWDALVVVVLFLLLPLVCVWLAA